MISLRNFVILGLLAGLLFARPLSAWAHEHAGQEHGGEEHAAQGEGIGGEEAELVGILREAADALQASHPDLAARLRNLAEKEAIEHGQP